MNVPLAGTIRTNRSHGKHSDSQCDHIETVTLQVLTPHHWSFLSSFLLLIPSAQMIVRHTVPAAVCPVINHHAGNSTRAINCWNCTAFNMVVAKWGRPLLACQIWCTKGLASLFGLSSIICSFTNKKKHVCLVRKKCLKIDSLHLTAT